MKKYLILILLLLAGTGLGAQELHGSWMVAERDTCNLYIDVYLPPAEAQTTFEGKPKPAVMYVFGGGFIMGSRNDPWVMPWFKQLTDNGYPVVAVDYRLGLKGQNVKFDLFNLLNTAKLTKNAVDMGVEDVFSAVVFLSEHQAETGIDAFNMVISGSSAGACISLSSEWEICTPTERSAILPEGFNFKGVMSFAGAIMTDRGMPRYDSEPCPQILFHGTADGAVNFRKRMFGRWGFIGSCSLVEEVFARKGYVYEFYRYVGHSHDIAGNMLALWPEEKRFLEQNVICGSRRTVDCTLDDPTIPVYKSISVSLDDIY